MASSKYYYNISQQYIYFGYNPNTGGDAFTKGNRNLHEYVPLNLANSDLSTYFPTTGTGLWVWPYGSLEQRYFFVGGSARKIQDFTTQKPTISTTTIRGKVKISTSTTYDGALYGTSDKPSAYTHSVTNGQSITVCSGSNSSSTYIYARYYVTGSDGTRYYSRRSKWASLCLYMFKF